MKLSLRCEIMKKLKKWKSFLHLKSTKKELKVLEEKDKKAVLILIYKKLKDILFIIGWTKILRDVKNIILIELKIIKNKKLRLSKTKAWKVFLEKDRRTS